MKMTVAMSETGRVTIPAQVRERLGIKGASHFEVDLDGDAILLRPAVVLAREDAWAYGPEHRALLERAHRDSREGRVRRLTEQDLERLGEEAEHAQEDPRREPVAGR